MDSSNHRLCRWSLISQLITLYITPVYYTYLDSLQTWMRRRFSVYKSAARI